MGQTDFNAFKWMNESSIAFRNEMLIMHATEKSDFFCNHTPTAEVGITPENLTNAPFFYTEVTGDFVMKVKVSHEFKDTYDSASVMVMKDLQVWAKACFELTDFDTNAVVSVVTNGVSDDANGCNIDAKEVWLQIARLGNSFAFHYSLDGQKFDMMRFFSLPVEETVKVGLLAQAPLGQGGERVYEHFSLELKSVKNIRMGV